MAKNRKNQAAAIRFGPVLKVVLLCSVICGSAIGYVWQKGEIGRLERQFAERTKRFDQLKNDNIRLQNQISQLHSVGMIDLRVRELKLGLGPVQPQQMVLLMEPAAPVPGGNKNNSRQFAQRSADTLTP
jgi:cell division protein FtsB